MRWVWWISWIWVGCSSVTHPNGSNPLCGDSLLQAVVLQPVHREPIVEELRVPGEVVSVPAQTTELRSAVPGTVMEVYVQPGQSVDRGTPLMRLRSPLLLERLGRLRALQAQQEALRFRLGAYQQMQRDSLVSLIEVRNTQAEMLAVEAEKQQLQEQLQLFRQQGEDFLLLAPRAGTVLSVGVSVGANVEAGDFLMRIADLRTVRLQLYLYAEQFPQIKAGMRGEAQFPGWDSTFSFTVAQFLPMMNEETHTVTAYVDVPNLDRRLLPGLFFRGKLQSVRQDSAVVVPLQAVVLDADQRYVVKYRSPCNWAVQPVEVLRQVGQKAYVRGLEVGDSIATHQVLFLYQQLTRSL